MINLCFREQHTVLMRKSYGAGCTAHNDMVASTLPKYKKHCSPWDVWAYSNCMLWQKAVTQEYCNTTSYCNSYCALITFATGDVMSYLLTRINNIWETICLSSLGNLLPYQNAPISIKQHIGLTLLFDWARSCSNKGLIIHIHVFKDAWTSVHIFLIISTIYLLFLKCLKHCSFLIYCSRQYMKPLHGLYFVNCCSRTLRIFSNFHLKLFCIFI